MPRNYANTRIYKLMTTADEPIYIGHTTSPLSRRLHDHKNTARQEGQRQVYAHFNQVGWEHVRIVLIRRVECANLEEARAQEQAAIDELKPALNMNRAVAECEHGRLNHVCKECGGNSICAHGRLKHRCKECGGNSICTHGRQKHQCKECGGISICIHGRLKPQCKECGGIGICEHGRQKRQCKECGGSSICEHGRQKRQCKECGGTSTQPIQCPCGATVQRGSIRRHERTRKHQRWIEEVPQDDEPTEDSE